MHYNPIEIPYKQDSLNKDIEDMRFVNSKNDNLIQLADMIAGSILRSTQKDKTDSQAYIKVVRKRVEDIWYFK